MTEGQLSDGDDRDNDAEASKNSQEPGEPRVLARVKLAKRRARREEEKSEPASGSEPPEALDPAIWHARALDALASDRPEEALKCCHQARQLDPDVVSYAATEVWIRAHLPRPDLKVRELELGMLLYDDAKCLVARYYRGKVRYLLGDRAGARQDFEHVLSLDPEHAGARAQLEAPSRRL